MVEPWGELSKWQWQEKKSKVKLAMLEDTVQVFTVSMAPGFLFSLWGGVRTSGNDRPGTQEKRCHTGPEKANQHKHTVKVCPLGPPEREERVCCWLWWAWSSQQSPLPRFTSQDWISAEFPGNLSQIVKGPGLCGMSGRRHEKNHLFVFIHLTPN